MKLWVSVLEEVEEDSFAHVDDALNTRSDQGVGLAGMVRQRVTRSGRRDATGVVE